MNSSVLSVHIVLRSAVIELGFSGRSKFQANILIDMGLTLVKETRKSGMLVLYK